jgi:hypothetical protein
MVQGEYQLDLRGLPLGAYDVWPEESSRELPAVWTRVGPAQRVVLDIDHPMVDVDITP